MQADANFTCDVLVVGTGIAGTCAALSAAQQAPGAHVLLASTGSLFSGSSFFGGTWGLGLVAPDGQSDAEDLVQTILSVGCGAADEPLVRSFVSGIAPAVETLEGWGVKLREPSADALGEGAYIPCFDHKHRAWHGVEREPYMRAVGRRLEEHQVDVREQWELLDLLPGSAAGGTVPGSAAGGKREPWGSAAFFSRRSGCFATVRFRACVLATGGTCSLFGRRLTRPDCLASVHALAKRAGCQLANLEFMQFMPGLVHPVENIVFNEKAFRYMQLPPETTEQLGGAAQAQRLLKQRGTYGPFTARLESRAVDFAIHQAGAQGLPLKPNLEGPLPEFVETYFRWLEESAGLSRNEPVRVAFYAHASNGGIRIDCQAETGVPGLFAAGECTGGMHGADRLGGLSSANGLVFGLQAGRSAAAYAGLHAQEHGNPPTKDASPAPTWQQRFSPCWRQVEAEATAAMGEGCGIVRTADGLEHCLERLRSAQRLLEESSAPAQSAEDAAATRRAHLRVETAQLVAEAAFARTETAGSHYRADCP